MGKVLAKLMSRNTDGLIGAIANVLKDNGIELMNSTTLLQPLLAKPGVLTSRGPTDEEQKDLEFGYRIADQIAALDIGQTIAVKHQAVVAVEAMEGTDEVIARAGHLAGPGVCIIKVAKPKQDMRFDVPVVGFATIQAMRVAGAALLSIDAGKTLLLDQDAVRASANEAKIAIVGRRADARDGRLRVGVIGVGYLGKHHARILSAMPGVELVGVVDKNLGARRKSPSEYGTRPLAGSARADRKGRRRHHRRADGDASATSRCRFSRAGVPVLVEKPMAREPRRSGRA